MKFSPGCGCCGTCDIFECNPTIPILPQGFSTDYVGDYPLATSEGGYWVDDTTNSEVDYDPPSGFTSKPSFTITYDQAGYFAEDSTSSGAGNVFIYVNSSLSVSPTAADKAVTVAENSGLTNIDLSGDVTGSSQIYIVSGPHKGSASVNGTDTIDYTPDSNRNGKDIIYYRAENGSSSACGRITITITPATTAETEVFTAPDIYLNLDDDETLTLDYSYFTDTIIGDGTITFNEIRSPNAKGIWIKASSYVECDTTLPTTGVVILTHGPEDGSSAFVPYEKLNEDIEIEIRDSTSTIAKLSRDSDDEFTITGDTSSVQLDCTPYLSTGALSTYSLFHELTVTHDAVQSRRYNEYDRLWTPLAPRWDDGTSRQRRTANTSILSHRMSNLIPAGSKARLTKTTTGDALVAVFTGDKVKDTLESVSTTCPDNRFVCTVVDDNHVQQWSSTITFDSVTFDGPSERYSENCVYSELDFSAAIDVSNGSISQDYDRTDRLYSDCFFGFQTLRIRAKNGSHVVTAPVLNSKTHTNHQITVTPTDIGGGQTRLNIVLTFNSVGVEWDGTNLNGALPDSSLTVTQTGDDLEIIREHIESNTSPVNGLDTIGGTGVALIGYASTVGSTSYRTLPFSQTRTATDTVSGTLFWNWVQWKGVRYEWDVDVTDWQGSSPTVILSGADATITGDAVGTNIFVHRTISTTENSSSFGSGQDFYNSRLSSPTTTSCGLTTGAAWGGPTGVSAGTNSWDVDVTNDLSKIDYTTLSMTLTGST